MVESKELVIFVIYQNKIFMKIKTKIVRTVQLSKEDETFLKSIFHKVTLTSETAFGVNERKFAASVLDALDKDLPFGK